jgi:hypothetical protein
MSANLTESVSAQEAAQTSLSLKVYEVDLIRSCSQTWSVLVPATSKEEAEAFTKTDAFMEDAEVVYADAHSESDGDVEISGIMEISTSIDCAHFEYGDIQSALGL